MEESRTRVLIVDDHPLFRRGLATLMAREPDLEPAAEAGNQYEAQVAISHLAFDVALVDVRIPPSVALVCNDQARQTRRLVEQTHIVVGQRCAAIDHEQDEISDIASTNTAAHALPFDHVDGVAVTGRIDQRHAEPLERDTFRHEVSGRSGDLGYYRAVRSC